MAAVFGLIFNFYKVISPIGANDFVKTYISCENQYNSKAKINFCYSDFSWALWCFSDFSCFDASVISVMGLPIHPFGACR